MALCFTVNFVLRDCERYFGRESLQPITKDDSVICSTEYSKIVPLEGGEVSSMIISSIKIVFFALKTLVMSFININKIIIY